MNALASVILVLNNLQKFLKFKKINFYNIVWQPAVKHNVLTQRIKGMPDNRWEH